MLSARRLRRSLAGGFAFFAAPLLGAAPLLVAAPLLAAAQTPWSEILREAEGQTVYFHAWGGDVALNAQLQKVAEQLNEKFKIDLQHIKLADTTHAVTRLIAEAQAGNTENGSADLIWINGENFAALKQQSLLFGPWAESLPHFELLDADSHPQVLKDFGVATDGYESPWTRSQLIFYHDGARLPEPPRSIPALLNWARANPSEFTYPKPPSFLGTTFLKQALIELVDKSFGDEGLARLAEPPGKDFDTISAPLWEFLDALHPTLLRAGRHFPNNGAQLRAALNDKELSLAFAFNPNEVTSAIARGDLAATTRSYVFDQGTLSNVSFVAIPFNAPSKAAAQVTANFLLAPEVQFAAAINPLLASQPVIPFNRFSTAQRQQLARQAKAPGSVHPQELSRTLDEPHPQWTVALESEWLARYEGGRK